ncbi:MAG: Gfo/Idh/MocA family protein [Bacillota bacterium]
MVRFGVIGAGNIAHKFSEALNGMNGYLRAIASSKIEKAQKFQRDYGYEHAYEGYDALFKDEGVDCVYIATPHAFHYEQMLQAIAHGKHVLCEKSFTLNEAQAKRVYEEAKKKGVFVMEAMWTRFLPVLSEVLEVVEKGGIGALEKIEANFTFDVPIKEDNRLFNKSLGGGALLDIGIYPITLVNMLMGEPKSFETTVEKHNTGVDIEHSITYFYEGVTAYMHSSFKDDSTPKAMIQGTNGKIEMDYFWEAEKAYVYNKDGFLVRTIHHPHPINGFEYEISEVIHAIESGKLESNIVPHKTTLSILRQMDAIRKVWNLEFPGE